MAEIKGDGDECRLNVDVVLCDSVGRACRLQCQSSGFDFLLRSAIRECVHAL